MNLNSSHSLQDLAFMLVRMMAQDEAVTDPKSISLLYLLVFKKLLCRRSEIVFRKIRIVQQESVHVRGDTTDGNIPHVDRNHFDQQQFGIAIVMNALLLGFLTSRLRFSKNQKVMHCDFRTEPGKFFNKRGNVV